MGGGFLGTFLTRNRRLINLDPRISALFPQQPLAPSLGDEVTSNEMTAAVPGMPNWKAGGPDSLPAELRETRPPPTHPALSQLTRQCVENG